jgi:hypothetical protein
MKPQSKWDSFKESFTNILTGYIIALLTQVVVFPWFGIESSLGENMLICLIFTGVSLVRLYIVRRYYNWKEQRV